MADDTPVPHAGKVEGGPAEGAVSEGAAPVTAHTDALPEELDVTAYVGPYTFPDVARRRIAAVIYLVLAAMCVGVWALTENGGVLAAAGVLVAIAGYHFLCGWHLRVDQTEGLAAASRAVGFPIGHASAQLTWRGLRSRPVWRILLYSAEEPPVTRGLVELDGVDGTVMSEYTEDNPEDWDATPH